MSNIDQAFINAYADQSSAVDLPRKPPTHGTQRHQPNEAATVRLFGKEVHDGSSVLRFDPPNQTSQPTTTVDAARQQTLSAVAAAQRASFSNADQSEETILLPPLGNDRRPLSAFAAPPRPVQTAFSPAFEVDGFQWPVITDQLLVSTKESLAPIVDSLLANAQNGHALIGLVGTQSGVGCSTVTMCLGRMIAQTGASLAVVDANFSLGNLASSLGLEFDQGWEHVLTGEIPLAECAVHSLADAMTLIPLCGPVESCEERLASIQTSVIAGVLRYHHDIVLVDLGSPLSTQQVSAVHSMVEHCRLDTTIIVAPSGTTDPATADSIESLQKLLGTTCMGVIGNHSA
ncbi:tyrosine-protein kinase family protein [Bythopirellula goksoeyrii]|uniref:Tyrosine kinase n=1 Tax=Bythopirellula goksoeyrii TaxID=1400387 RepID=A0A5B9Q6T4_9BACT|nr:CpsD/CapB family tyrosine-protein kinase [Bythopirellula goksoeyrii]QEG33142.1 tyrosine kinase [Bythopirellula goksoeyrii]